MISRWSDKKPEVIKLRRRGKSIRDIEKLLGIPRSTLSGWLRTISLTALQHARLKRRHEKALASARIEAIKWHNAQKEARIAKAAEAAAMVLGRISDNVDALELALAFLYLGEGSKTNSATSLGSSDPRIATFFVKCLQTIYGIPTANIRCYLHLRADQNSVQLEKYWANQLKLPRNSFGKASLDKRTVGRPTYSHYKGVCLISCGRVDIQRRLMYIANGFCEKNAPLAQLVRATD